MESSLGGVYELAAGWGKFDSSLLFLEVGRAGRVTRSPSVERRREGWLTATGPGRLSGPFAAQLRSAPLMFTLRSGRTATESSPGDANA